MDKMDSTQSDKAENQATCIADSEQRFSSSPPYHVIVEGDIIFGKKYSNITAGIINDGVVKSKQKDSPTFISGNTTTQQQTARRENCIEDILQKLNKFSWETTCVNIGDVSKGDRIIPPDFEVNPQIVESRHFYRGGHEVEAEAQFPANERFSRPSEVSNSILVKSSMSAWRRDVFHPLKPLFNDVTGRNHVRQCHMCTSNNKNAFPLTIPRLYFLSLEKEKRIFKQPQYQKERLLQYRKYDELMSRKSTVITNESVISKIHRQQEKCGILGLIAQAGAGKTTYMRRWARRTLEMNGITRQNGFKCSDGKRFKLVHFINMKTIKFRDEMSLQELLFDDVLPDTESKKIAYQWVIDNQSDVVLFLDGFDQAPWIIEENNLEAIGSYGISSTPTVFYNLLSRNILPGVQIVISSREYKVTALPKEAWIGDILNLTGFSEQDAKKLFNALTNANDTDDMNLTTNFSRRPNWDKLAESSPSLLPLLSIPAFLMFAAIVYNYDESPPISATDLMTKVLETIPKCTMVQTKNGIWTIIDKLKKLSHTGMEKGLVIFSEKDLFDCGLTIEMVRDLLIMVPRTKSECRIIEGDNIFFFCHQSMQEFLSACAILEMDVSKFTEFVNYKLNHDHWLIVCRFLCGLTFAVSPDTNLQKVTKIEIKRSILRDFMTSQMDKIGFAKFPQDLEFYSAICESQDEELIKSTLKEITIRNILLGRPAAYMIVSLIKQRGEIERLEMTDCGVDDYLLNLMTKPLEDIKINSIDLTFNKCSFGGLLYFLRKIEFEEADVDVSDDSLQLNQLDLKKNQTLTVTYRGVAKIIFIFRDFVSIEIHYSDLKENDHHSGIYYKKNNSFHVDVRSKKNCLKITSVLKMMNVMEASSKSLDVTNVMLEQFVFSQNICLVENSLEVTGKIEEVVVTVDEGDRVPTQNEIERFCKKFKVHLLSVVFDLDNTKMSLAKHWFCSGCQFKVYGCAYIRSNYKLREILRILRSTQVEYVRLRITYEASLTDLKSLVEACKMMKQLTLIDHNGLTAEPCQRISETDENELREVATSLNIDLQINSQKLTVDDDPWSHI